MDTTLIYSIFIIVLVFVGIYSYKQIKLAKEIALKDTTLENIEEKLKKHKLIGGRHKRTNKKNPPIV
ncbi:MAG: CMP-2-keto-3-deoxyoctulosonic acid synthetase [Gammaproteobacteria bacterium]|jgi:CMP-2-keto-3-deoxyoctulosonic acid synthetase|tara:strand:- start:427 stop:627 length:201 start_codon:yes stop_codon:yes gene_type:complete